MTVTTGEIAAMPRMAKNYRPGIFYDESTFRWRFRVTFIAGTVDTESSFTIMARSTRFALIHLRHRIADTAASTNKNGTVAVIALEHLQVFAMTEFCIKSLKSY